MSMCSKPLRPLSSSGASGSLFYLTHDDVFIIKTVDAGEHRFLLKLLLGYYMVWYGIAWRLPCPVALF